MLKHCYSEAHLDSPSIGGVVLSFRRREKRIKDRDLFETVEEVWDRQTLLAAYEIMRRLRLDRFAGVVSSGKEARVYRAIGKDGRDYAVKVYLTVTAEFRKSIQKYLLGDPRFQNVDTSNTKKLFFAWARKEYRNLKRMFEVGANVPKPFLVYQNIVVMEFIGRNGMRAPLLHEIYLNLEEDELLDIYSQVTDSYRKAYCCAKLVHADLSEYNIMYLDGKAYLIDVAQAVLVDHPNSRDFLYNDIKNLHRFYTRRVGIDIGSIEDVAREMTDCRKTSCPKTRKERV